MSERVIERYGWVPDIPDFRDFSYCATEEVLRELPLSVDLRCSMPIVYDQSRLGSCTANAIGAAHQFNQMKQKLADIFIPSRLFIYYNEREMEGRVNIDSGAQIRDGMKSINSQGVCSEATWPYDIGKFKDKPSEQCYNEATKHQALEYSRVAQDLNQMKGCLASGFPFVFGFAVYTSFESEEVKRTGVLNMPKPGEVMKGGHAVLCCGYISDTQRFIIRNSWGENWGDRGYFTMPFEYLTNSNLSADHWVIKLVEDEDIITVPTSPTPIIVPVVKKSFWRRVLSLFGF